MMKPLPAIAAIVSVLAQFTTPFAQGCCGIGGSLVAGGHPVLDENTLLASSSVNYSDAENPERRRSSTGVLLAYGITDRLSLSLKTSYAWAWSSSYRTPITIGDRTLPGETIFYKNNGFADGYAALQFALIRLTPMNKQELIAGADVGLPWGPDRRMVDGVVLPGGVQTGSGGYSVNGYCTYLKAFPLQRISFSSTINGRIRFINRIGKDPGDEFSAMFTSLFGPYFNTRESLTLNFSTIGMTYNELGLPETGTPGKRLSLTPAFEYLINRTLRASITSEIPVWRDKNQALYGNNRVFSADLYLFIPLKHDSPDHIKTIRF